MAADRFGSGGRREVQREGMREGREGGKERKERWGEEGK